MKTIHLSEVLSEVNQPNSVFSLKYRKADGKVGFKQAVVLRSKGNEANGRRKMNRSGLLSISEPSTGYEREITIDFILEFNGMRVVRHRTIQ
jgi:hypothetical protein